MPPVGEQRTQISEQELVATNHDGQAVFVDSTALTALQNLSNALGANDSAQIQAALAGVDTAFDNVQHIFTETGARSNRLEQADQTLSLREFDLTQRRSGLQDSDLAAVPIDIASRQVVLESAMAAASRAFGLTLNQYLR
ncbi:MAG: flagellin-like hook-associated protein FlgL [Myxococcota bacterium]|jgi:flagellin-like hook-associated protein FlgL